MHVIKNRGSAAAPEGRAMPSVVQRPQRRNPLSSITGWRSLILASAAGTVLLLTLYARFLLPAQPDSSEGVAASSTTRVEVDPDYAAETQDAFHDAAVSTAPPIDQASASIPPPSSPPPRPLPDRANDPVRPSLVSNATRDVRRRGTKRRSRRSRPSSPSPSPPSQTERQKQIQIRPPWWGMSPAEELVYAKREIDRAPLVSPDDPELHGPLFRNVSAFKRSYELMEQILKVYVYRDGPRPIFHTPQLRGIYASEGWFMRHMENNRQFVVRDPEKAHLFYIPYSARQLELALYVPESHNLRPLSIYLKDYVNGIASRYPFWNRTRGADHFLVACHDWGPYTTTAHDELLHNSIKALCNADVSEHIFQRGRDVSLPETTIRNPRRPLRSLGGRPISQRTILAFCAGNMHGRVRPVLSKYWDGTDPDMRIYGPLPDRVSRNMSYVQHMKTSKFCICPMGYEVNSPRIVEAIYYECVPVIIADGFVLPMDEVFDWGRFSVTVEEKDIPRLKEILVGISPRRYISLHRNVQRLQRHFLWHPRTPVKYDLFHMILHSIWFNRLNQIGVIDQ